MDQEPQIACRAPIEDTKWEQLAFNVTETVLDVQDQLLINAVPVLQIDTQLGPLAWPVAANAQAAMVLMQTTV